MSVKDWKEKLMRAMADPIQYEVTTTASNTTGNTPRNTTGNTPSGDYFHWTTSTPPSTGGAFQFGTEPVVVSAEEFDELKAKVAELLAEITVLRERLDNVVGQT